MCKSDGNEKEPPARVKEIDCNCHPKMLVNHIKRAHSVQGYGRGPTRLIRLVRRVPPTTDETRLKTSWSMTSALQESLAATAMDDGDSVGVTSADDESGNAWSEDSDDIKCIH